MKKYLIVVCLVFLGLTHSSSASAMDVVSSSTISSGSNISALLEQLQVLMKQVEALQKQLATIKGEIRTELKSGLKEGMDDDDIKKIQELLATDSSIYPKGIVSGYYGPLTVDAIKRFQERHDLPVTGKVDEATKTLLQEYFKEKQNGKIPPGLLKAPGISKKILERWKDKRGKNSICDDLRHKGLFCEDYKDKDKSGSSTDKMVSTTTVSRIIGQAEDAVEDLTDAIKRLSATTTDKDLREAKSSLVEAERLISSAKASLTAGKLRMAYEQAYSATKIAKKALERLVKKKSPDDDDDEDDSN